MSSGEPPLASDFGKFVKWKIWINGRSDFDITKKYKIETYLKKNRNLNVIMGYPF